MRPDYIQERGNLLTLLNIHNLIFFARHNPRLDFVNQQGFHQLLRLPCVTAHKFQMVSFLRIAHGADSQKRPPQKRALTAETFDNQGIHSRITLFVLDGL